jgi:hypothetical protein
MPITIVKTNKCPKTLKMAQISIAEKKGPNGGKKRDRIAKKWTKKMRWKSFHRM